MINLVNIPVNDSNHNFFLSSLLSNMSSITRYHTDLYVYVVAIKSVGIHICKKILNVLVLCMIRRVYKDVKHLISYFLWQNKWQLFNITVTHPWPRRSANKISVHTAAWPLFAHRTVAICGSRRTTLRFSLTTAVWPYLGHIFYCTTMPYLLDRSSTQALATIAWAKLKLQLFKVTAQAGRWAKWLPHATC